MKFKIVFKSEGFEIKNTKSNKLTKVTYTNCFSSKATTKIKNNWYFIEPRTMWGNEFYLLRDHVRCGHISQNWQGNVELEVDGDIYELTNVGVINNQYEVKDRSGAEILQMKPNFQWTRLSDDYEITKLANHENITLLIFMAAFATHYYEANLYI